MRTYISTILASTAEAEDYVNIYQKLIENAGGRMSIKLWEHKERDNTTLTKETTSQGETTTEVTQDVATVIQRGLVLSVTLPEEIPLPPLLEENEALAFKSIA